MASWGIARSSVEGRRGVGCGSDVWGSSRVDSGRISRRAGAPRVLGDDDPLPHDQAKRLLTITLPRTEKRNKEDNTHGQRRVVSPCSFTTSSGGLRQHLPTGPLRHLIICMFITSTHRSIIERSSYALLGLFLVAFFVDFPQTFSIRTLLGQGLSKLIRGH